MDGGDGGWGAGSGWMNRWAGAWNQLLTAGSDVLSFFWFDDMQVMGESENEWNSKKIEVCLFWCDGGSVFGVICLCLVQQNGTWSEEEERSETQATQTRFNWIYCHIYEEGEGRGLLLQRGSIYHPRKTRWKAKEHVGPKHDLVSCNNGVEWEVWFIHHWDQ